jgi:hypothetical protein
MTKTQKSEKQRSENQRASSVRARMPDQEVHVPRSLQDTDVAEYIAEMLIPLRHLAIDANTGFLSYLIEMAIEEAHLQSAKKN